MATFNCKKRRTPAKNECKAAHHYLTHGRYDPASWPKEVFNV